MDIVAGKIAAEDGRAGRDRREGGGEVGGVRDDAGEGAHAGVDDFLGKEIGAVGGKEDAVEGEPIGEAEQGADVAGVLHAVEGEGEAVVEGGGGEGRARERADGEDRGRCGEMAGAGHLRGGELGRLDVVGGFCVRDDPGARGVDFGEGEIRREQFGDDFFALDDEEAKGLAGLFLTQGAEALEGSFGRHRAQDGAVAGDGSSAGLRGTESAAGPGAVHREQARSHTEEKRRARRSRRYRDAQRSMKGNLSESRLAVKEST